MLIRVHLDHITLLDRLVTAVEDETAAALDAIPAARGVSADGARPQIPARVPRCCPRPSDWRRSRASA
jgi:hypothetical protein